MPAIRCGRRTASSIAFSSTTAADDYKKPDPGTKPEHKSDVKVVSRAVYRANGNPTYVDADRHAHIWVVAVARIGERPTPRQVTTGEFDERGAAVGARRRAIYFTSDRRPSRTTNRATADLYRVPAAGGEMMKVASIDGPIGALVGLAERQADRVRRDPATATRSAPTASPISGSLTRLRAATPRNLTASYDFDVSGGIGGDQSPPRGEQPQTDRLVEDGSSLIVVDRRAGQLEPERVSLASGAVEADHHDGGQDIVAYTATPTARGWPPTISTQTNIGDISVLSIGTAARRRRSRTSTTRSSLTSVKASRKKSGTPASTAARSRAGF